MEETAQSGAMFRIGLVATNEVLIAGLQSLLGDALGKGTSHELVVLNEAGAIESSGLKLVLIDAGATDHVFELLESFRRHRPRVRLVLLAGESDEFFIERAIEAGARGVLHHTVAERELRMAIDVVADGSVWAPRRLLSRLLDRAYGVSLRNEPVKLTLREEQVIELLVRGLPNRLIAEELGVEQVTVKSHLGRLMRKAGVTNRTALGVHALAANWVSDSARVE